MENATKNLRAPGGQRVPDLQREREFAQAVLDCIVMIAVEERGAVRKKKPASGFEVSRFPTFAGISQCTEGIGKCEWDNGAGSLMEVPLMAA
ncbi:MAG TPA: hypothetical protein VF173_16700 [Thermoanaerobaculia bacterium]|nr:hypothetical protein [Thermoanaerobaculia bacterium]